jgi:hypothetical protein
MSEKDCDYVSSKGLLKSCDIVTQNTKASTSDFPDLNTMFDGCTIYVCSAAISNFVKQINDINVSFVLVSGDDDEENYNQMFDSYDEFLKFISNEKIIHWFSQNCNISHPKITHLPIGLDYHSTSEKHSPIDQENTLKKIKSTSESFDKRIHKCYVNFSIPPTFYRYYYDREEALNDIPKDLIINNEKSKRDDSWLNQTKYSFVVSPFGNGLDCHRTWEALIFGCIPIVRSSGMNPLFDDLPVLIVNNWTEVTQELLDLTIDKFKNKIFNYDKLLLRYWVNKINSYKQNKKQENFSIQTQDIYIQLKNLLFYIIFMLCILLIFVIMISNYKNMSIATKQIKKWLS